MAKIELKVGDRVYYGTREWVIVCMLQGTQALLRDVATGFEAKGDLYSMARAPK